MLENLKREQFVEDTVRTVYDTILLYWIAIGTVLKIAIPELDPIQFTYSLSQKHGQFYKDKIRQNAHDPNLAKSMFVLASVDVNKYASDPNVFSKEICEFLAEISRNSSS